jgi:hypothetical protein
VKTPAPPWTVSVTGLVVTGTDAPRVAVKPEPQTVAAEAVSTNDPLKTFRAMPLGS